MTGHDTPERQLALLADIARRALLRYDLPPGSTATQMNLSENATYRIDAPNGQRWALQIHREGYQSRRAIASELAWAIDLRQTAVATTPRHLPARTAS